MWCVKVLKVAYLPINKTKKMHKLRKLSREKHAEKSIKLCIMLTGADICDS